MSMNMVEALTLNVNELMKVAVEFPGTLEQLYYEQVESLE